MGSNENLLAGYAVWVMRRSRVSKLNIKYPEDLYATIRPHVEFEFKQLESIKLAEIALVPIPEGKTDLYSVHCGSWLNKYEDANKLIFEIAITRLVAHIWDMLH